MLVPETTQQIKFCRSRDDVSIAYATMGTGPVLVKAAHWLSHLDYDARGPTMGPLFCKLAESYTLLRYDERCCGLSDWNATDLSLEAFVGDLEAVVDAAGVDRFPLVGVSQGGPVAIAYAVRHPERVSRLVLYGTYARPWMTSDRQRQMLDAMVKLSELGWGSDNPACRQLYATLLMPDSTREEQDDLVELQRLSATPENAARLMRVIYSLDVHDLARLVTVPTLVAHTRNDGGVPYECGRELASLIPGAEFLPLESRNHLLTEREPAWQRFLDAIRAFLAPDLASSTVARSFPELSEREREVLERIARGDDNGSIAAELFISPKTVRNHVTSIFRKIEVRDRSQAIVRAREAGYGLTQA